MKKLVLCLLLLLTAFPAYAAIPKTVKVSDNDTTAGYLNGKLVAGSNISFTEGSDGSDETLTISATAGGGTGVPVVLDLSDDGTNESTDLAELSTKNDTNSIFTEPSPDKLYIDLSKDWPKADLADAATALAANGSNCSAGSYPLGVDASGAVESCTDASTETDSLIAVHTASAAAHHDAVTLGGSSDASLALSTQELTLTVAKDLVGSSPLSVSGDNILPGADADVTISIADADDDGATKGAATFDNTDFDATAGVVTIVDDGHAHTTTSISGIDISSDTNLTAGDFITLTGDDLDVDVLDEDDMASNSANHVPTQQSVKRYVDDSVAAAGSGDITSVFGCASGACTTVTIGESQGLIGGAVDGTTDPYISLPQGTDCSSVTGEGKICWDSDGNRLYVGDGVGVQAMGGAAPIEDTAFSSGWDADTTNAPTQNAVYDILHQYDTNDDGTVDTVLLNKDLVAGTGLSGGADNILVGADADVTVALDATELDAVTWSDGANASNAWTFDVSGTDPTLTAGDDLLTVGGSLTVGTGKNIKLGSTQWNSGDSIDGENIATDTIDDDSIDFADVTGADLTLTDAGNIVANASLSVKNGSTTAGVLSIFEDSDDGTNKATFTVPALSSDTAYTLPADDGDAGEQLQTNGSGTLSWEAKEVITAGRSLTRSTDDIAADAELYTETKSIVIETPTDSDNFILFEAPVALTVTRVSGIVENATSAVLTAQECDSAADNCSTIEAVTADVDGTVSTSIDNASVDAGDWVRVDVGTVTGTVGHATLSISYTLDD